MAKAIEWLKANYELAVLAAAAVLLLISALAIWWSAIQFNNRLIAPLTIAPKTASQPPVAVELDRAAEQLEKPLQWKGSVRSSLFVPEKHFIGPDGMPATLRNTQVHAPVPNEWFEKYSLAVEDADALEQDPDKDGFTNLDEWQGNTDPTKAQSHPDYITKLHLVSATEEPFAYIFASRTKDKYGMKADMSELLLEHQGSHAQVMLVKGQVATSPQSVATFVYTWGGRKEFEVRKDQEFPLPTAEGNRTYKVIDVRPEKAVIVNTQNPNVSIEIGFAAP
jgi:hypothetical protein